MLLHDLRGFRRWETLKFVLDVEKKIDGMTTFASSVNSIFNHSTVATTISILNIL